jgi:hypothetical protein
MTNRVRWTETVSCLSCGKMGKVTLSGPAGGDYLRGGRDRVERGFSGFKTEEVENGFQFRCVDCRRLAHVTKPERGGLVVRGR